MLEGGDGRDELYGNDGNDTLRGGAGGGYLYGGAGDDSVGGRRGTLTKAIQLLYGEDGDDTLIASVGYNELLDEAATRSHTRDTISAACLCFTSTPPECGEVTLPQLVRTPHDCHRRPAGRVRSAL
ncbi:MAG: hypothetical protein MZW92_55265 [Comamonadaceae bacterium]|nr:hypothetical protein [Comamonadaceae bacterium]